MPVKNKTYLNLQCISHHSNFPTLRCIVLRTELFRCWIFNKLAQFTLTSVTKFCVLYLQSSLTNWVPHEVKEHCFFYIYIYPHIQCLFLVALYKWHDWMCFVEDAAAQMTLICCQAILRDYKKEKSSESNFAQHGLNKSKKGWFLPFKRLVSSIFKLSSFLVAVFFFF